MSVPAALRVRCPAKVNLDLRVLGRRPDGFHEIRTVFQAIDLWDEIEVSAGKGLSLRCDDPSVPRDESNLILRAAELLRSRCRVNEGATLALRKSIPVAGGLGGGSSDAAGTLLGLSRLWRLTNDATSALGELAAEVGSDVPFFLHGGTAVGTGRGESIAAVPFAGRWPVVLGCPPFGLSTALVYARASDRLTARGNGVTVPALFVNSEQGKDFGAAVNDLEAAAFELHPELRAFRDALRGAGAVLAMLSGSGSTVYGIFREEPAARTASRMLGSWYPTWRVVTTRTVPSGVLLEVRPWR